MLFYESPKNKAHAKAMVDFMKWALSDGQKFAGDLGYAPLPAEVVKLEMDQLAKIKVQ
jgi:phosphate transport system substrate-binding protein